MRRAVRHLKQADPILRAIIERVGPCRMRFGEPTFHSLAEAIIYQQLNGKAALTIFRRFTTLAGDPLTPAVILPTAIKTIRVRDSRSNPTARRVMGVGQCCAAALTSLAI